MVDPLNARIWSFHAIFVAVSIFVIFLYLLPLDSGAPVWAAPDLIMCLTLAWVLRQPDYVPALLIAFVLLTSDIFFHRPPGLYAALVVGAAEFLRIRAPFMRDYPFMLEWLSVSMVILAVLIGYRAVSVIVFMPLSPLILDATLFVSTVLAYPLVVVASRFGLGLQKQTAHDVIRRGQRL